MKKVNKCLMGMLFLTVTKFIYGAIDVPDYVKEHFNSNDNAGVLLNRSKEYFEFQRLSKELEEEKKKDRKGIEAQKSGKIQETEEGEIRFKLKGFSFSPSEVLSEEELNNIVAPYLKGEVSVNDLYEVVNKINALYEEKGYVVCRAGLPPQTISDGIVRIVLVEGKTGRVIIQGNNSIRESYIRKRIDLNEGEVSNLQELNKSLVWFNGTNDVQMRIELAAGELPGTTDYILSAYEPKKHSGSIFADNAGSETSGEYRGGVSYINNSLTGHRDQLSLSGVGSDGTTSGAFMYIFPINRRGTKIALQYSIGKVEIVDGPLKDVEIEGESSSYGVSIIHPFLINEKWKVEGNLDFSKQNSKTDFMGFAWVDDDITKYSAGVAVTKYGDTSIWYNKHNISKGKWESISGDGKDYMKYDTNFMYQRMCWTDQMFTFRLNGQYAFDDYLPSADQFYVGGTYSVRGYAESFMGADHGASVSLEYSVPTWKKEEFFVFLDGGILEGENAFDNNQIYSAGFGYRRTIGEKFYLSATLGVPFEKDFEDEGMEVDSCRVHVALNYQF